MLQSRRGFLIGVGAVLTTAFVKDASSFIDRTGQPLLASPSQVIETMYWHEIPDKGYQLTLGPWSIAPPPPKWRIFCWQGIPHRTDRGREDMPITGTGVPDRSNPDIPGRVLRIQWRMTVDHMARLADRVSAFLTIPSACAALAARSPQTAPFRSV